VDNRIQNTDIKKSVVVNVGLFTRETLKGIVTFQQKRKRRVVNAKTSLWERQDKRFVVSNAKKQIA
jgi:hypothetical protein